MATLAKYLEENNIQTLFVTSSSKALEELKDRAIRKFGVKEVGYYETDKLINFINAKGFWSSQLSKGKEVINHLKATKVLLFDEVEMSLNDKMTSALDNIFKEREYIYGFSATTNKVGTDRLTPYTDQYFRVENKALVSYFGYATVYMTPHAKEMTFIDYVAGELDVPVLSEAASTVEALGYVSKEVYGNDKYIDCLERILDEIKQYGTTFVPINRTTIIEDVISRFKRKLNILVLDSNGYRYNEESVDVIKAKELVGDKKVDVFFSTKSGYNSIDFPNIANIFLMLEEKVPHSLLQSVGRSRMKEVNIVTLSFSNRIPIYTKRQKIQVGIIKEYYKLSVIKDEQRDI